MSPNKSNNSLLFTFSLRAIITILLFNLISLLTVQVDAVPRFYPPYSNLR